MHISWAKLASFGHLGLVSDPLIVAKFHNESHDPKGQENKIYTIVKGKLFSMIVTNLPDSLEIKDIFKYDVCLTHSHIHASCLIDILLHVTHLQI